jgi:hypothetical protein
MSTRLAIGAVGLLAGLAALGTTVGARGPQILTLGHYGAMRPFVHRVKRGDAAATTEAGRLLGELLPEGAVLVPVPSSKGGLGGAGALGRSILAARPDVSVVPALRGVARQSTRDRKKRGKRPLTHHEMWFLASQHALPQGRPVYLLDNVVDTGATIRAARRALGPLGAQGAGVVALAHTGRHGSLANPEGSATRKAPILGSQRVDRAVADEPHQIERWRCPSSHLNIWSGPCGYCGAETEDASGFYYSFCFDGLRRNREEIGPFESSEEAIQDARRRVRRTQRTRGKQNRGSRQWLHGAPRDRCASIERDGWIKASRETQELPTLKDLIRARREVMAHIEELEASGADDDTIQQALEEGLLDTEERSLTPMEGFAYAAVDGAGREFLKDSVGNCVYEVELTPGALVVPDEDWLGDLFLGQVMGWGASRGRPRSGTGTVSDPAYQAWRERLDQLVPWQSQWTQREIELINELMEEFDEDTIALRAAIGRDLIAHLLSSRRGRAWLSEGAREYAPSIAHEGPMRVLRRVELPDPAWMASLDRRGRAKIQAMLSRGTP